jgi:WD40 repeat protein
MPRRQACTRGSASLLAISAIGLFLFSAAISRSQERLKLLTQLGIGQVNSAAISPDGQFVVTGTKVGKLTLWFADTATQMASAQLAKSINSVAFSPDGRMVAAGCEDGTASLWDVSTFRQVRSVAFEPSDDRKVLSVAFSNDGKWIATGSSDDAARIWDRWSGKLVRTFKIPLQDAAVNAVVLSSDRKYLLTGSTDIPGNSNSGKVRIWNTSNGELIRSFDLKMNTGDSADMLSVAFSADDKLIVAGGDFGVGLWNAGTGQLIHSWRGYGLKSVAISPDGRFVAAGGSTFDDANREIPDLRMFDAATGELIRNLNGHMDAISSVAFSSDGRFILSGSVDGSARLWDPATGREEHRFEGSTSSVESIDISPNDQSLLIGNADDSAHLWDLTTGQEIREFDGRSNLASADSVAFSPDESQVLTAGGLSGPARLWDASTGNKILSIQDDLPAGGVAGTVRAAAFSPDGRFVLTGNSVFMNEQMAWLWDRKTGGRLRSYGGHSDEVTSAVFSPDGRFLVTGGRNGGAWLWDAATGSLIHVFHNPGGGVSSLAFSPDGHSILVGCVNKTAALWDIASGNRIHVFKGHTKAVMSVAFSQDGRHIVTGSQDATAKIWDASTGELQHTLVTGALIVNDVAFATSDQVVMTAGVSKTTLWNAATGEPIREIPGAASISSKHVAISQDGRYLLEGVSSEVSLYDAASGKKVRSLVGHSDHINSVAISSDGRYVLTGSDDKTTRLWDIATGQQIRSFRGNESAVNVVAFSPDGKTVMSGEKDKSIRIWDAEAGRDLQVIKSQASVLYVVAFASDDGVLTGGTDGVLKLWDRVTGREIRAFEGLDQSVHALAVSADHRLLLAGSEDHTARLWELATGKLRITFTGHTDSVRAVAISRDMRYVLTGSDDKTARLWDAATGRQLRIFAGHESTVSGVAFTKDLRFVLTGSDDTTTRVWDLKTGRQLATLLNFGDKGWAVVDPEGRFDTNDLDGGSPLAWLTSSDPLHPLPLEIFMRDYYTPRLLATILSGETLPPVRPISEIANRVQPDVDVVSITPSKRVAGRVDVVVHAASHTNEHGQSSGLRELKLFRSGQLVGYRRDDLKDGDFTFAGIQLPASGKSVFFTAYAFNSAQIKSSTAQKDYTQKPVSAPKPRAWLVQIGVNHYNARSCELHGSANDAAAISNILSARLKSRGFEVHAVQLVSTGSENHATKEDIQRTLEAIAAQATPDDAFFLSFSGHGYGAPDGQFYILPSDIEGSCQDVNGQLLAKAISADELTEWLRPIDAGEMTFVLDSCDSASSVRSNGFKPGPMGSRGLGQLAYDKRMRILAASQPNQAARESNSLHQGLLSYALTQEGLVEDKADWRPVDQKITVGEWLSYAANAVPKYLEAGQVKTVRGFEAIGEPTPNPKAAQTPAVFDFSRTDTFVIQ